MKDIYDKINSKYKNVSDLRHIVENKTSSILVICIIKTQEKDLKKVRTEYKEFKYELQKMGWGTIKDETVHLYEDKHINIEMRLTLHLPLDKRVTRPSMRLLLGLQ